MEYQEIVTAYKNKNLDTSTLEEKLEVSKSLNGRSKYRTIDISSQYASFYSEMLTISMIPEEKDKIAIFQKQLSKELIEYYKRLINNLKEHKAWSKVGLVPREHTIQKFEELNLSQKLKETMELNKKYAEFLEFQGIADIRDYLYVSRKLNKNQIRNIEFLLKMFHNIESEMIRREAFCLDEAFLKELVGFKKSKEPRLEAYIKTRKQSIQNDYKLYSSFFSTEEYRDLIECLVQTSRTIRMSIPSTIRAFHVISESEAEKGYLEIEHEVLEDLYKKYEKMLAIKSITEERKEEKSKKQIINKKEESKAIEKTREKIKTADTEKLKVKLSEKVSKEEIKETKTIRKTHMAKEKVYPLLFSWLEREDITLTRRVGSKNLTAFFDKIKEIEAKSGTRVALFIITNAGKDITFKRIQDFQKKARTHGLPRLVEGALGGYGTFKVDLEGNVTPLATMSEVNRKKIIKLLSDKNLVNGDSEELVVQEETNYVRYQFSDRRNKSITMEWLKRISNSLLKDKKIASQPIKIMPFIEGRFSGIDVVLNSQLEALLRLPNYYKDRYCIVPRKILRTGVDTVKEFIENSERNEKDKDDNSTQIL